MKAFLFAEHGGKALEVEVGVFDFAGVAMGNVGDFFEGKGAFFGCFGAGHVFDEHGADDG